MDRHATTGSGVTHRKRRILLGSGSVLFVVFVICWFLQVNKQSRTTAKLPESIEEYRAALNQPDFGMYFLDFSGALKPSDAVTVQNSKSHLYEILGRRSSNMGSTESIGNLVANYSAVAGKRVCFGRTWREVTNSIAYDDSTPRTRRETLQLIESILRTNGGFIFSLNSTCVVLLTDKGLRDLSQPIPRIGSSAE